MRDMEEYAALNEVYASTFNFPNPPTRVCVQCPLPDDVGLILDAVSKNNLNPLNIKSSFYHAFTVSPLVRIPVDFDWI